MSSEVKKKYCFNIKFPATVSGVKVRPTFSLFDKKGAVGSLVRIRPVYGDKTYLGLLLGDLPIQFLPAINNETQELEIFPKGNPAIYVFDLKKIVYGIDSWWEIVTNEEEIKSITNSEISDLPYFKLLRAVLNAR